MASWGHRPLETADAGCAQGLLERDAENSCLAGDDLEAGPMEQLLGSSMMRMDARISRSQGCAGATTYRIRVGPQQGRKVLTLQTLPACDELFDADRKYRRLCEPKAASG